MNKTFKITQLIHATSNLEQLLSVYEWSYMDGYHPDLTTAIHTVFESKDAKVITVELDGFEGVIYAEYSVFFAEHNSVVVRELNKTDGLVLTVYSTGGNWIVEATSQCGLAGTFWLKGYKYNNGYTGFPVDDHQWLNDTVVYASVSEVELED